MSVDEPKPRNVTGRADPDLFRYDYDTGHLVSVRPIGRPFEMLVTPRFRTHYERSRYEEFTSDLIASFARGVSLFVDVGAHYGYFTLLVSKSNPACELIALEPVPENLEVLRRNLESNNIATTVALNLAASNVEGRAKFFISGASDNCSFVQHPAAAALGQIEVQTITLDQVIGRASGNRTPVLVKVDTDGHELEVLEGMRDVLTSRDNIRLIVECNPRCLRLANHSPQELLNALWKLDYDVFVLNDAEGRYARAVQGSTTVDLDAIGTTNLCCIKRSSSLNVAVFSHSSGLGGAERTLLATVNTLIRDQGALCTVCLPGSGPLAAELQKIGAAIIHGDYSMWCAFPGGAPMQAVADGLTSSFEWLTRAVPQLDLIGPDVILTNTLTIPWGALAAAQLGRPHVWSVNEFGEADHGLRFHLPFSEVLSLIVESSNVVRTCSNAVRASLFDPLGAPNVQTVYNRMEYPEGEGSDTGEKIYAFADSLKLICVGQVLESKGQQDAVRAAIRLITDEHRNVELALVGPGDPAYIEHLRRLVVDARARDRIHFVGFQRSVYPFLEQADALVLCSRQEAFGRVTIEAILKSKPVIATNTGGTPELIMEGQTGLLYEPGNVDQLMDKIRRLMDQPGLSQALGQRAREFAQGMLGPENTSVRYRRIFARVKGESNPRSIRLERFRDALALSLVRQLADVKARAALMEQTLPRQQATIDQQQAELRNLQSQLDAARGQLAEIESGAAHGIILKYRAFIERAFPLTSRRRRLYNLALEALRTLVRQAPGRATLLPLVFVLECCS